MFSKTKKNMNSIEILIKLLLLTSNKAKRSIYFLAITSFFTAFFESLIVIFIVPIISILTNNSSTNSENTFAKTLLEILNLNFENESYIFIFGILILLVVILRILNLRITMFSSASIGTELSLLCFKKIIRQDYCFHEQNNSSEVISSLNYDSNKVEQSINAIFQYFSAILTTSFLIIGVFLAAGLYGLFSVGFIALLYLVFGFLYANKLKNNSYTFLTQHRKQTKLSTENLRSIKNIILTKNYNYHINKYKIIDQKKRNSTADTTFKASYPRYIIESIILLSLGILSYIKLNSIDNSRYSIGLATTIGFASLKIIPSLQLIYSGWSRIQGANSSLHKILGYASLKINKYFSKENISWENSIRLTIENFKYKGQKNYLFNDLDLTIKKGEKIFITGKSGSGKTTFINFLMGLKLVNNLNLFVDNIKITNNKYNLIDAWHSSIAHISQEAILVEDTIAKNIAFGIDEKNIDYKKLEFCAKKVDILDYIKSLKYKFENYLSEDGGNLSGGQRQRLLLERALYLDCSLLIIDEGTSALDDSTEINIIKSLVNLNKNLTIIFISHNRKIERFFDKIIDFDKATLELIEVNSDK